MTPERQADPRLLAHHQAEPLERGGQLRHEDRDDPGFLGRSHGLAWPVEAVDVAVGIDVERHEPLWKKWRRAGGQPGGQLSAPAPIYGVEVAAFSVGDAPVQEHGERLCRAPQVVQNGLNEAPVL